MKNPRCSQCENAEPQPVFRCRRFPSEDIVDGEIGSCDAFCEREPEPDPRVEELEKALQTEKEWMHAPGEDSRSQQAMLDKIAIRLGIRQRNDLTDLPALLNSRLVQLETALDEADCTQREGGDTRHCDIGAPCWRCIAEKAEKRIEQLEGALRLLLPSEEWEKVCREAYASTPRSLSPGDSES